LTTPFRFPVGPDSIQVVGWRGALSDEEWMVLGGLSNKEFFICVLLDTGIDLRSND
jgi:hypothetical protein